MWKQINNYPDYEINYNDATVRNIKTNKILKPYLENDGYHRITLCKDKKRKNFRIHRLMGLTFLPNSNNKPCVDHKNRNRSDNRLVNLKWATLSENQQNRSKNKNNTTGYTNIRWQENKQGWEFHKRYQCKQYSKFSKDLEVCLKAREEFYKSKNLIMVNNNNK